MNIDPAALVIAASSACIDVIDDAVLDLPVDERTKSQMRTIVAMTLLARVCVESGLSPKVATAMVRDLLPGKMTAIIKDTAAAHGGDVPS